MSLIYFCQAKTQPSKNQLNKYHHGFRSVKEKDYNCPHCDSVKDHMNVKYVLKLFCDKSTLNRHQLYQGV